MTFLIFGCKHDINDPGIDFNILEVTDIRNVENLYVTLTVDPGS